MRGILLTQHSTSCLYCLTMPPGELFGHHQKQRCISTPGSFHGGLLAASFPTWLGQSSQFPTAPSANMTRPGLEGLVAYRTRHAMESLVKVLPQLWPLRAIVLALPTAALQSTPPSTSWGCCWHGGLVAPTACTSCCMCQQQCQWQCHRPLPSARHTKLLLVTAYVYLLHMIIPAIATVARGEQLALGADSSSGVLPEAPAPLTAVAA